MTGYKRSVILVAVMVVVLSGFCLDSYAYINNNHGGRAYQEESGVSTFGITNSIEDYIVMGAGAFLNAHSSVQEILKIFELQDMEGIDSDRLRELTSKAVQDMRRTVETYTALVNKAAITPYNTAVFLKLVQFDYGSFRQNHGLNPFVFNRVAGFLKHGNVTGLFQYSLSRYIQLLDLLNTLNQAVNGGEMPELSLLWKINEGFSNQALLGSYAARVFYAL
jgi:hypothetical protein